MKAATQLQLTHTERMFAKRLKDRREELGLTQAELADRLECHAPYISDLENGKKSPQLSTIERIAIALETTPAFFFQESATVAR